MHVPRGYVKYGKIFLEKINKMENILVTTTSFGEQTPDLLMTLENSDFRVILNPYKRKLTEAEAVALIAEFKPIGMIAGVEPLTRSVLQSSASLKVVSRCGIGLDSVDLEAASELGIVVTNTPDAPTVPVAELTVGLILSLLRGIAISDAGIRRGEWVRPMGHLLRDKTVGVIGCGRVGARVAKFLSIFECRVVGYDPMVKSSDLFEATTLEALLNHSDIVSLHLPYTEETHHLLNSSRLNAMKYGSFLVNAARGGLVDEKALYECLQSGHLGGAALDCFEQEPYIGPLRNMVNVVLTGHIGSYAKEGRAIMEQQAVENLLRELKNLADVGQN
jgi:D-3-phosphoglycerate dehydrogenase / 2-oxoglutarate reductase